MDQKMNVIRYETKAEDINFELFTIFLAGPTVRGNQPHLTSWRFEAIDIFKRKNFEGNLIVPEFSNKHESDKHRQDLPIWEFHGLKNSHVNMFWIPRTRELIGLTTNFELGYWMGRYRDKVVYGRPDDAYRIDYLDIMWGADYDEKFELWSDFIDTIYTQDSHSESEYNEVHESTKCLSDNRIAKTLEETIDMAMELAKINYERRKRSEHGVFN